MFLHSKVKYFDILNHKLLIWHFSCGYIEYCLNIMAILGVFYKLCQTFSCSISKIEIINLKFSMNYKRFFFCFVLFFNNCITIPLYYLVIKWKGLKRWGLSNTNTKVWFLYTAKFLWPADWKTVVHLQHRYQHAKFWYRYRSVTIFLQFSWAQVCSTDTG